MSETIIYNFLFFLILFTIFFAGSYLITRKKLKKKKGKIEFIDYLVRRFSLDEKKIPKAKMVFTISMINAFIISFVATVITMLDMNILWQIMIGFVLIFGLIYSLYEIYGRSLVKKGYQKERKK